MPIESLRCKACGGLLDENLKCKYCGTLHRKAENELEVLHVCVRHSLAYTVMNVPNARDKLGRTEH